MPACHVAPPWQKWFLTFFSRLFDVSEDDTLTHTHTHMDPLTKYRLTLTNPNIQCDISDFLARMSSDGKAHGKLAPSSSVSKERDTTVCFLFAFIYLYLFTLHVFYFNIPELNWTGLALREESWQKTEQDLCSFVVFQFGLYMSEYTVFVHKCTCVSFAVWSVPQRPHVHSQCVSFRVCLELLSCSIVSVQL